MAPVQAREFDHQVSRGLVLPRPGHGSRHASLLQMRPTADQPGPLQDDIHEVDPGIRGAGDRGLGRDFQAPGPGLRLPSPVLLLVEGHQDRYTDHSHLRHTRLPVHHAGRCWGGRRPPHVRQQPRQRLRGEPARQGAVHQMAAAVHLPPRHTIHPSTEQVLGRFRARDREEVDEPEAENGDPPAEEIRERDPRHRPADYTSAVDARPDRPRLPRRLRRVLRRGGAYCCAHPPLGQQAEGDLFACRRLEGRDRRQPEKGLQVDP